MFFYIDDIEGIICRLILPPNAAFRQVDGQPCLSKDEAKRDACLKACIKLHELGALTDFLLPGPGSRKNKVSTANNLSSNKVEGMFTYSHNAITLPIWLNYMLFPCFR